MEIISVVVLFMVVYSLYQPSFILFSMAWLSAIFYIGNMPEGAALLNINLFDSLLYIIIVLGTSLMMVLSIIDEKMRYLVAFILGVMVSDIIFEIQPVMMGLFFYLFMLLSVAGTLESIVSKLKKA